MFVIHTPHPGAEKWYASFVSTLRNNPFVGSFFVFVYTVVAFTQRSQMTRLCRFIGNGGMHGHYCVVFAKLIIDGKDQGMELACAVDHVSIAWVYVCVLCV